MNFSIRAWSAPWRRQVELQIQHGDLLGVPSFTETLGELDPTSVIAFKKFPNGISIEPSLRISMPNAQSLMDDLWNAGLRPTEGTGSAGSLAATERHLQDMRRLLFDPEKKGL